MSGKSVDEAIDVDTEEHGEDEDPKEISSPPTLREVLITPQKKTTVVRQRIPRLPPTRLSSTPALLAHNRQKKNPVLKYIDNCLVRFSDTIIPDFVMSPTRCATFIRYCNILF